MSKNEENWLAKYTALCDHVEAHGHLADRHTQLNHWWKYQKKKRKEGKLTEEQCRSLDELYSLRSHEHTGGRKKVDTSSPELLQELWTPGVIEQYVLFQFIALWRIGALLRGRRAELADTNLFDG